MTGAATRPETTPDIWIHWVSTYFVDPENWIGQMYDSRFHGTWKASLVQEHEVDELLTKARGRSSRRRARRCTRRRRAIVAESPDIWVYNTVNLRGVAARVQGFRFCPVGQGGELRWMRLES